MIYLKLKIWKFEFSIARVVLFTNVLSISDWNWHQHQHHHHHHIWQLGSDCRWWNIYQPGLGLFRISNMGQGSHLQKHHHKIFFFWSTKKIFTFWAGFGATDSMIVEYCFPRQRPLLTRRSIQLTFACKPLWWGQDKQVRIQIPIQLQIQYDEDKMEDKKVFFFLFSWARSARLW